MAQSWQSRQTPLDASRTQQARLHAGSAIDLHSALRAAALFHDPCGENGRKMQAISYRLRFPNSIKEFDFQSGDTGGRWSGRERQRAAVPRDQRDTLPPAGTEAIGVIFFRGAETHTRSVLKAISWRTLGTLDTFAISWFMTGRVEVAGSIAGIEIITKIAWYYLHERLWALVTWGRR